MGVCCSDSFCPDRPKPPTPVCDLVVFTFEGIKFLEGLPTTTTTLTSVDCAFISIEKSSYFRVCISIMGDYLLHFGCLLNYLLHCLGGRIGCIRIVEPGAGLLVTDRSILLIRHIFVYTL